MLGMISDSIILEFYIAQKIISCKKGKNQDGSCHCQASTTGVNERGNRSEKGALEMKYQ